MRKGKYGIVLVFYAVLAFALVILRQPLICALVMLAAIFLEKDEWASRQTMQAFMLLMIVEFFRAVSMAFGMLPIPFISSILSGIFSFVSGLAFILALVFSILGIIKVLKEQDAGVPILSDLAYKAYGKMSPTPPPVPPAPPMGTPQGYPQGYQNNYQPQQPQEPTKQPVSPAPPQVPTGTPETVQTPAPPSAEASAPVAEETQNNTENK